MYDDTQDPNDGRAQTVTQAPQMPYGPVVDPNDPRLKNPAFASDPEVLKFLNGRYDAGGTAQTPAPGSPGWDPLSQTWNTPKATETGGTQQPPTDPLTGPLTKPYDQTFTPPTPSNIGGPAGVGTTPQFNGPAYTPPPAFKFNAPTAEQAMNDPGYQFRVQQGNDRLQNWAAARGTLNDSSTAKDLQDYGQQSASQEYQQLWDRDWQQQTGEYATNYATQYQDPYNIAFGQANAQNQNNQLGYTTNAAATQHSNDTNYLNAFNLFNSNRDYFSNWQDRVWNKQFQYASS